MSLADLAATVKPRSLTTCITCTWYDKLPKRDRIAFDRLVARPDITNNQLRELCRDEEGLEASESSFKRHIKNHHGRVAR